jgi:putative inorganic carbon (HCO3(-)) transporter
MTVVKIAKWSTFILGIAAATVAGTSLAALLPELSLKVVIAAAVAAGGIGLIIAFGHAREVLLAAYIVALTYHRQYYSFDNIFGTSGSQGLYWGIADLVLLALLATSFLDIREPGQSTAPLRRSVNEVLPVLPFLAICCLSALAALRPDWAVNDTLRVVKFTILMFWLHRYMSPSLWMTAVVSLAVACVAQSLLGTVQVLLKGDSSLLAMVGLGTEIKNDATEIENRARGTMGHPNILAPWLLLIVPAAFCVALFARRRGIAAAAYFVAVAGFAGIFFSKSRAPTAILVGAIVLVAMMAIWLRALSPRVALGASVVLTGIAAIALVPFLAEVTERITSDFSESVKFRTEYNDAALAMWNEYPLLGVGLNNVNGELERHSPLMAQLIRDAEKFRDLGNVRGPTVHNVYLLILAETGLLGLFSFLVLLGMLVVRCIRAGAQTRGATRGLCLGVAVGFIANYIQQTVDFSLWYDASWYTIAVLAVVVGAAPTMTVDNRYWK